MSDNDNIPVLDLLRDQLVAAIDAKSSRRRWLPTVAAAGAAVGAVAVVIVLLAAHSGGRGRHVIVGRPLTGQLGPSTATTTLDGSGKSTPLQHPAATTGQLPAGTIVLSVVDRNRTIAVPKGTVIDVRLNGDNNGIWPFPPTSSNGDVVKRVSASSSPTSSRAEFVATALGTSTLSSGGAMPCAVMPTTTGPPQVCLDILLIWSVIVTVN